MATKFKRAKGFVTARTLSNKEEDDIERNIHTTLDILNGAIAYVKNVTRVSSSSFNAHDYEKCIKWLAKIDRRSEKAKSSVSKFQWFRMFCGFQMEDNWVHVRFLIEALRAGAVGSDERDPLVKLMNGVEKTLVAVFALIRAGADDPMPYILVVDGVLRCLWRQICKTETPSPRLLQKKLFNELALWCHGTAINAFVIRLPRTNQRYVKGEKLMVSL